MVQVSYPGVYIQEISSGVHTITSVGTSITAFVDYFCEGPVDQAVEIFGMADFQRVFGGLDGKSEASYAIAQFFLNGGSSALVIRCLSGSKATANVVIGTLAAPGTAALTVNAANPGEWGNTLRVEIDHQTSDPAKFFNLTVTRYTSTSVNAAPAAQERFLNLSLDSTSSRFAPAVIAADAKLITATVANGATGVAASVGTTGGDIQALTTTNFDAMSAGTLDITVGGSATFTATLATWAAGTVTSVFQLASRLEQAIRTAKNSANDPTPPCLTGASVQVKALTTGERLLAITAGKGDGNRQFSDVIVIAAGAVNDVATPLKLLPADTESDNVQQYVLGTSTVGVGALVGAAAGANGSAPDADALVGAVAEANNHGIYALEKADLFNLLCIPRTAAIAKEANGDTPMRQIVEKAIAYCIKRRAFYLLDIPESINEVAEVKDWLDTHGNFRSTNAAVFFPRLKIADPLNDFRLRSVGPSGTTAGVFARTDSDRGVWKAPAGIDAVLRGVADLDAKLTDAENGTLNPLAINCLRTFPVYGTVSWGARTLDGADQKGSEWKYIPIRRLALMLEESLFRGTKWVVFEPNDEPLWAKIRLNLNAFMMSLFRQGAFQGTAPKDAFFVKCDAETTTQDDRNKGIVNIIVGFAPLKPAEFVVISIQQIAGQL